MKTGFSTARRHALIAISAAVVLLAGAGCTSTERSTGTVPATAASTAGESFVGSASAQPSTGTPGTAETPATGAPASRTSPPATSGTAHPTAPATESSKATKGATAADPTALAFPDQPAVVAAAKASVDQVVQLHALAVSAGHPDRIPGEVIPSTASTIADTLGQQATMILALAPAADSEQAKLADALDGYQDLAGQLAKWDPASEKPLSAKFFAALAKNDRAYLAALKKLGAVTGENLVEGMPELLMPTT